MLPHLNPVCNLNVFTQSWSKKKKNNKCPFWGKVINSGPPKHPQACVHRFTSCPCNVNWLLFLFCGVESFFSAERFFRKWSIAQTGHRVDRGKSKECKVIIPDNFDTSLKSTQRLVPYYILCCLFRTSLIEIWWGLEVKWTVKENLTAVEGKKGNDCFLYERKNILTLLSSQRLIFFQDQSQFNKKSQPLWDKRRADVSGQKMPYICWF